MKTNQAVSLAKSLRRQLIWLGTVLSIACVLLMFSFVLYFMESTTSIFMRLEAQSIINQAQINPAKPLPQSPTFSAWRNWQDIPQAIRHHFADDQPQADQIVESEMTNQQGDLEFLYLMHHTDHSYGSLFLMSRHGEQELETAFVGLLSSAFTQSLTITLLIMTLLFLIIGWLFKRSMEPLEMLNKWAKQLNQTPEKATDTDFGVTELNAIAKQLQQGVKQVQAANERERHFLKHASHELRTPLAIIQASLDTLNLQTAKEPATQRSVKRALTASNKMIQLSDTLLWLATENGKKLHPQQADVSQLCSQLIEDHRYLLHPDIKIQQDYQAQTLCIEVPLLAIVMANLIRNAFENSHQGPITVKLTSQSFSIYNLTKPVLSSEDNASLNPTGFGLGLQLVQRICHKMTWDFNCQQSDQDIKVTVYWP